ncbi:MAG: hypothetical protein K6U74_16055, partial [Firmicutes bacterium]|nr:hypothetical protein [Bacillota bacterium]
MDEIRLLSPTAILGYGFPEESFKEGLSRNPHAIAVDAGSTDPGPYYLGAGKCFTARAAVRRDLEIMLAAAVEMDIPLLIGTAGGSGGGPHVERDLAMIRDIAREKGLRFKMAVIHAEVERERVRGFLRQGLVSPLGPAPALTEAKIGAQPNFAAQLANGNVIFRITFGGTLAGYDVPQLTASAGTVTTVQEGRDPRFAMFIGHIVLDQRNPNYIYVGTGEANNSPDSFYGTGIYRSTDGGATWQVFPNTDPLFYGKGITKIIIDPNQGDVDNPVLFVAVAEGGNGVDEIQEIRPNLPNGTQFTLTFTGPDSTGNIVSLTTNWITYDNRNQVNPSDPLGRTYHQITADTIASELNALANIGGIGGFVTVTPPSGRFNNRYTIRFGGTLSQTNVQQLTTNWPQPPNGPPNIEVTTTRQGGPPGAGGLREENPLQPGPLCGKRYCRRGKDSG